MLPHIFSSIPASHISLALTKYFQLYFSKYSQFLLYWYNSFYTAQNIYHHHKSINWAKYHAAPYLLQHSCISCVPRLIFLFHALNILSPIFLNNHNSYWYNSFLQLTKYELWDWKEGKMYPTMHLFWPLLNSIPQCIKSMNFAIYKKHHYRFYHIQTKRYSFHTLINRLVINHSVFLDLRFGTASQKTSGRHTLLVISRKDLSHIKKGFKSYLLCVWYFYWFFFILALWSFWKSAL